MDRKYTLITGGTKGIGLELAKLFAKDKNNLVIVSRILNELEATKKALEKEFKVSVEILKLDLSIDNSCEKLIEFVEEKNLVIENLVNNAGIGSFGYFDEVDTNKDIKLIDINIVALTRLIKYFLPLMKERE